MGLFPFRRNLTSHAVDLGLMSMTHPAEMRELLTTVYRLTAEVCCRCRKAHTTHLPTRPTRFG